MGETPHKTEHPFHLVDPSPWPLLTSLATLMLGLGAVLYIHNYGSIVFWIGVLFLLFCMGGWWKDVLYEAMVEKKHTKAVQMGLRYGMLLFIVSEIMFFAAFFGSFFTASIFPPESIGGIWPPKNILPLDPFDLPYLNTLILLLSATSLTWAHEAIRSPAHYDAVNKGLWITVILGLLFTCIQVFEYIHAPFSLKDGIYGSNFYMLTGFHGAHVIIGTIFLSVCLARSLKKHFTPTHHIGFEAAAWYWHFVDVVWLFLFVFIYWWGS